MNEPPHEPSLNPASRADPAAEAQPPAAETTIDAFLGGELMLEQPSRGYRAGLDAVILAAAVPRDRARSPRILDAGAGIGTVGLCLAFRLPEAHVTLLERQPRLSALSAGNIERNGLADRVRAVEADVTAPAGELAGLGLDAETYTDVAMNPPYHDHHAGTLSGNESRASAHAMPREELDDWIRFAARVLQASGRLTLIHKAANLPVLLQALSGRFGAVRCRPLLPRTGAPASRIVLQAIKGSRAPFSLLDRLVLHDEDGRPTSQLQAMTRNGAELDW